MSPSSPKNVPALHFQAAATPLAERQHGIVTRRQLFEAGLARHIIDQRVRSGRLRPIHRGVYLLEGRATPDSHLMAAVLACGPKAMISHVSAGVRWRMLHWLDPPEAVDVTGADLVRRHPGVRTHRSRDLRPSDGTRVNGLSITTASRTIVDVAPLLTDRGLERAVAEGIALKILTERTMAAALGARKGRPGTPRLRKVLGLATPARTRSEAEERLLALVRAAGLPEPRVNRRVFRYEIDFFWPESRLAVEVDGFAFHTSRHSFERDRRRDQELLARGIRVMRITGRQIMEEPGAVLTRLGRTLASDQPTERSPG